MAEFCIELENLRFYAHHGMYEHERNDGNEFEVNLYVSYTAPDQEELQADELVNTISYVSLFNIVKKEMNLPRKLLETVACNIAKRIRAIYPHVGKIRCQIVKLTPPIAGFQGKASVTYTCE